MIRPYQIGDKSTLLKLLEMNTPDYFAPSEKEDYIEYLDEKLDQYFVVEEEGEIIGCGGLNFMKDGRTARISWDMIHPEHQGKGIGKKLTQHRIQEAQKKMGLETIVVRTSQLAYLFYEKNGFTLDKIEKDFWAKGFDLYQMSMAI